MMSFMDTDFFLLDGQVQKALQERHCDIDHVDEPIDIFLYDKDRSLIAQWLGAKSLSIKLDKPEIHYLELRSDKQTRYRISTYMMVDPKILPDEIERAKVFPDWWGKGPFVKIEDHPNFHVVEIGTGEHELNPAIEAALRFQDLAGNTQIALLDERGAVIRKQAQPLRLHVGRSGSFRSRVSRQAIISYEQRGALRPLVARLLLLTCSRLCDLTASRQGTCGKRSWKQRSELRTGRRSLRVCVLSGLARLVALANVADRDIVR